MTVQTAYSTGDYGRCKGVFKLQCQEKDPVLAFKDAKSYNPLKFVRYHDYSSASEQYWKLVLQSPEPDCWTATR